MPVTYELETPTGAKYDVEFDNEPTPEMLDAALKDINRFESDTGQSLGESAANAAARGAIGLAPSVVQGFGALIPGDEGEDIRARGKAMQQSLEATFPVNPLYEDATSVKAASAVGKGLAFLGGALASGGSTLPVLGVAGLAGAAGGADIADQYGLEGWRRDVTTLGTGAAELASESIFGIGTSLFLKGAGRPGIEAIKAIAGEAAEEPIAGALTDVATDVALIGTDKPKPNPFDLAKRGEEALYGAIGAAPFGGIAALNARRLRGAKLYATVDGQMTPLPDDITDQTVKAMGLKPEDIAVVPGDKVAEMEQAILRARTQGQQETIQSVMLGAAATPSIFDAPPPTAEEIAALDETPEEVIQNEEEGQILQGGPEVTEATLAPETTNPAVEGSAPGGVGDLGASPAGPATGSSAPVVSSEQLPAETPAVNTEVTPDNLSDAIGRWQVNSSDIELHAYDEVNGVGEPSSQSGRTLRGYAKTLIQAAQSAPLNDVTLYRGGAQQGVLTPWTSNKKTAELFAQQSGGEVLEAKPGTIRALKIPDSAENEYISFAPKRKNTTVEDLATSNVTAKRNVDPAAFRAMAKENIRPAPESIAPPTPPANPIPLGMAAAHLARVHGLGAGQVDVVSRPNMQARGWLDPKTGRPVINVPWIRNADEVSEVLYHEITHRAEEDPAMRPDIDAFMATLTPAEINRFNDRLAKMKYQLDEFPTERAAIAISEAANRFRGKSGWAKLVQRVRTWWKELTGQNLNRQDAEAVAARIVARAIAQLKAGRSMVRGRVSGNVRRSAVDPRDAEYLAAVERGDMETAQRMVDEAAKAAGYNVGPVWHGTNKDFNSFIAQAGEMTSGFNDWPAVYFFPDQLKASAEGAARWKTFSEKGTKPRVIKAYLRLNNPTTVEMQRGGQTLEAAKTAGHDGKIHTNDNGEITEYSVFDPSQIKSADPVTRDDQGNVIPLSQRFNPANDDIRFSKAESALPADTEVTITANTRSGPVEMTMDARDAEAMLTKRQSVLQALLDCLNS